MYLSGKHISNINTRTVYTANIQTLHKNCNNNRFITLDNFNVLKILLILKKRSYFI